MHLFKLFYLLYIYDMLEYYKPQRKTWIFLSTALAVVIVAICFVSCLFKQNNQPMHITIDVLSGKQNPQWIPTQEQRLFIEQKLQQKSAIPCSAEPDLLGYKGFIISDYEAGAATGGIRVYRGKIWYHQPSLQCYKDPEGLEELLIQYAGDKGFAQYIH